MLYSLIALSAVLFLLLIILEVKCVPPGFRLVELVLFSLSLSATFV